MFASIITPFMTANLRFFFQTMHFSKKKIFLKQSYIILSWFYYMRSIKTQNTLKFLRFFVLPTTQQVYTLTKAPIAHKTWSKEQYKFQFYLIRISFNNNHFVDEQICNLNQGLLFFLLIKKTPPYFASNLLLIKNFRILISVSDTFFFKYK